MCNALNTREPGRGEQREDAFEWPKDAVWSQPERRRERPGDQQRHHVRVGSGEFAEFVCDASQFGWPVRIGGIHR
jgi:hypothetical protein